MKKLFITILFISVSFTTFAQTKEKVKSFEEVIAPYVQRTLSTLDKGIELVKKETPIVIQQYLVFEAISLWLLVATGIIIIPLSMWTGNLIFKEDEENLIISTIIWVIGVIVGFALIGVNLMDAIKVTWFPKLYLVEHFINLF